MGAGGGVSPDVGGVSPDVGGISPDVGGVSPDVGGVGMDGVGSGSGAGGGRVSEEVDCGLPHAGQNATGPSSSTAEQDTHRRSTAGKVAQHTGVTRRRTPFVRWRIAGRGSRRAE